MSLVVVLSCFCACVSLTTLVQLWISKTALSGPTPCFPCGAKLMGRAQDWGHLQWLFSIWRNSYLLHGLAPRGRTLYYVCSGFNLRWSSTSTIQLCQATPNCWRLCFRYVNLPWVSSWCTIMVFSWSVLVEDFFTDTSLPSWGGMHFWVANL